MNFAATLRGYRVPDGDGRYGGYDDCGGEQHDTADRSDRLDILAAAQAEDDQKADEYAGDEAHQHLGSPEREAVEFARCLLHLRGPKSHQQGQAQKRRRRINVAGRRRKRQHQQEGDGRGDCEPPSGSFDARRAHAAPGSRYRSDRQQRPGKQIHR